MEEVRRLRQEAGLSQSKLATLAGVNKVTLVHIENGKTNPNVETLEKLAHALGCEVRDFFPLDQPSLTDFDRAERVGGGDPYEPWLDFTNSYAERWQARIDAGDIDLHSVDEFTRTVGDLAATLRRLNADEVRGLPQQPYSFGAPAAKTGVALLRLGELTDPLLRAMGEKFEDSELGRRAMRRLTEQEAVQDQARGEAV